MERYFLGNNTASGFQSFYKSELAAVENVVMLKGGPGTGKSSLLKKLGKLSAEKGLDYELWFCSGDTKSVDGVYIPELSAAVIDATAPHALDPDMPVIKETIFNLAAALDRKALSTSKDMVEKLLNNKMEAYRRGYEHLKLAFCHLQQQNRLYDEGVDVQAIRRYAVSIKQEIDMLSMPAKKSASKKKMSDIAVKNNRVRHLYSRAITPDGEAAYYDHLIGKRIFWVRGGVKAREIFFDMMSMLTDRGTILHLPLDPSVVEGIIVDDIAVVGEAGHLAATVSEVIDLGVFEGRNDFDAIGEALTLEKKEILSASKFFAEASRNHLEVEKYYIAAMDFGVVDGICSEIVELIFK